jgi:hypothetical protein
MDRVTREDLQRLVDEGRRMCASLFVPMERVGPPIRQNAIRFKNVLSALEEQLHELGLSRSEVQRFVAKAKKLDHDEFWQHQGDGLALFLTAEGYRSYRLPMAFRELVLVGHRFHLKPLLPLALEDDRFHLLCLSQNKVQLFSCDRYASEELHLQGMPRDLESALGEDDPQKQLQFHTGTPNSPGGVRGAQFHGQGGGKDNKKEKVVIFLQKVANVLDGFLREPRLPLVLGAAEPLASLYKQVSSYPRLLDSEVPGNPERSSGEALRLRAWEVVENELLRCRRESIWKHERLTGSEVVSSDLEHVIKAACAGRVESLLVALDVNLWGRCDPETLSVAIHAERIRGDQDLLDVAAIETLRMGGSVTAVDSEEVPGNTPLTAILRY